MPNPNEVMDVEAELQRLKREATNMFHNDHADGDTAIYGLIAGVRHLFAQQNAALLRELLEHPLFKVCDGCSCDAKAILEAKLNELDTTKELK